MNKQERITNYINEMFGKENVRVEVPDCVQNDCYMEGASDGKIVFYNIRNCSKNLLSHSAEVLHITYGVSCASYFDTYSNSGTIKMLIKDDDRDKE